MLSVTAMVWKPAKASIQVLLEPIVNDYLLRILHFYGHLFVVLVEVEGAQSGDMTVVFVNSEQPVMRGRRQ